MDDDATNDDDPQSRTPSSSPSPPPTRAPPPFSSGAVTVAASPHPHHQTLTLALPIQNPSPATVNSNGAGREDCWSEGATSALIDAWGERYVDLNRGNLKQKHWQEVADAVSARDDYTKSPKTDVQCKNRIDTLKKKYKSEKSKIASGQSQSSTWPFFHRLDILIGPNFLKPPPSAPPAFPPQFPQKSRTQTVINSSIKKRSPLVDPEESSDGLPPAEGSGIGMKELTRAILRFGEVYERVERAKVQQMVEVEKQRMGFTRELELQRMQFFVKTQVELSQLERRPRKRSRRGAGSGSDYNHHNHQNAENGNDGNSSE